MRVMATFGLVHGGWSGAHGWRSVRPLLSSRSRGPLGHGASPDFPGARADVMILAQVVDGRRQLCLSRCGPEFAGQFLRSPRRRDSRIMQLSNPQRLLLDLRHTQAALLIAQGEHPKVIQ